jgi:hypothetical protein
VEGSIEMHERDIASAILQMSLIYRARWPAVLWAAFYAVHVSLGGTPNQVVLPVLVCGMIVVFLFVQPRLTARRLVQSIARGGDRKVSYRFDAEGLTITTAGSTTTFAYQKLVRVREVKSALLLYANPRIANIVPKRAFSEGELARVRALLAPHGKAGH